LKITEALIQDEYGDLLAAIGSSVLFAYHEASVRDGFLCWQIGAGNPAGFEMPDLKALRRFIALENAGESSYLRYAKTFGPLWLCEHELPYGHPNGRRPRCYRRTVRHGQVFESLTAWQRYSRRAAAVLRIAYELDGRRCGSRKDWAALSVSMTNGRRALHVVGQVEQERRSLERVVNEWLYACEVRPFLSLTSADQKFELRSTLLGSLGVQLLSSLLRAEGFTVCSACGQPYAPTRRPRQGENHYCQNCGRRAANKLGQRRYRERQESGTKIGAHAPTGNY